MKHVFIVHSPITYLSALGVILTEKIDKEDVLILSETFRLKYEPIPIFNIYTLKKERRFSPYKNLYKQLDIFLKEEYFTAYIPVFHYIGRYLIIHPKCCSFNFTEEGLAAYHDYFTMEQHTIVAGGFWIYSSSLKGIIERLREILRIIRGYSSKINAIPTLYIAYATNPNIIFYGFHKASYSFAVNKKELSFSDISTHYSFPTSYNLNNSHIWIGDPEIHLKAGSIDIYLQSISDGYIDYLRRNDIKFSFVKFHYRENESLMNRIKEVFLKNEINIEIIPNGIVLELELMAATNVTLFGFHSSLLLYGAIMGHTSYSIVNYAPYLQVDPVNSNQISIFKKFVKNI